MKASWKQWSLAVLGTIVILIGEGTVIFYSLAWYWAAAVFLVSFACFSYVVNLQARQRRAAHSFGRPVLTAEEFAGHYFPPEQMEIAARLRRILADHFEVDISKMSPTDRFVEDLLMDDFDSIATVDFAIATEKEFGIEIPDSVAEKLETFQSVVDYVARAIDKK